MKSTVAIGLVSIFLGAAATFGQGPSDPRYIGFSFEPIIEAIRPGDRHVVVESGRVRPAVDVAPEGSFLATILEVNPVILVGRIVGKEPAFLLRGGPEAIV